MEWGSLLKILKINLKHNFLPHFITALLIACLTPVIFGISSLGLLESAQPLEKFLSITGIVLLVPVFLPEQDENIYDLIRSKPTDYLTLCLIRLLYSVFCLAVIMGIFTVIMHFQECEITIRHFIGGLASALFLGSLGFFFAGISKNTLIGYMISLIYYIANFAMKDELKYWYLFSMSAGSFTEKYWLMGSSVLLIAAVCIKISRTYS